MAGGGHGVARGSRGGAPARHGAWGEQRGPPECVTGGVSPLPHPVDILRILGPDVDACWRVVQHREVPVLWPLENRVYGLRDFTIGGPDGVDRCCVPWLTTGRAPSKSIPCLYHEGGR